MGKSGPNATFEPNLYWVGLALGWGVRRFHNSSEASFYLLHQKKKKCAGVRLILVLVCTRYVCTTLYDTRYVLCTRYVCTTLAGTFRPWTHTSDDSYIYQLSLVVIFTSKYVLSDLTGFVKSQTPMFLMRGGGGRMEYGTFRRSIYRRFIRSGSVHIFNALGLRCGDPKNENCPCFP